MLASPLLKDSFWPVTATDRSTIGTVLKATWWSESVATMQQPQHYLTTSWAVYWSQATNKEAWSSGNDRSIFGFKWIHCNITLFIKMKPSLGFKNKRYPSRCVLSPLTRSGTSWSARSSYWEGCTSLTFSSRRFVVFRHRNRHRSRHSTPLALWRSAHFIGLAILRLLWLLPYGSRILLLALRGYWLLFIGRQNITRPCCCSLG